MDGLSMYAYDALHVVGPELASTTYNSMIMYPAASAAARHILKEVLTEIAEEYIGGYDDCAGSDGYLNALSRAVKSHNVVSAVSDLQDELRDDAVLRLYVEHILSGAADFEDWDRDDYERLVDEECDQIINNALDSVYDDARGAGVSSIAASVLDIPVDCIQRSEDAKHVAIVCSYLVVYECMPSSQIHYNTYEVMGHTYRSCDAALKCRPPMLYVAPSRKTGMANYYLHMP